MPSFNLHAKLTLLELALAGITFLALWFIVAPYGRHVRPGWGPSLPAKVGWILMESPAVVAFIALYAQGNHSREPVPLVLAALWLIHYFQRVLIFPFRLKPGAKEIPVLVALLGFAFNLLNASVNAPQVSAYGAYEPSWLVDPRFIIGAFLFFAGLTINIRADSVLLRLRKPGVSGYSVPKGALHDLVASPNYLGEILEWTGWAIATWSLAGGAFAIYTAANLVPRAVANLEWYRASFPDYPPKRRAIFPWLL